MKANVKLIPIAQLVAVLFSAAAIKLYYSTAGVNDLLWILAPTSFLVEMMTGVAFTFETGPGFMSEDHAFLIAPSCSGVNFMITAFLMLTFARLWRGRSHNIGWIFMPVSAVAAYLTTLLANTVRISTALQIRRLDADLVWLNPDQLHRFEGIVVYFGFLLLLFVVNEKVGPDRAAGAGGRTGLLRRFLLPLLIYYATTIGVPLASGAYRGGFATADFWEHSLFVLLIPILLLLVLATLSFFNDQRTVVHVRRGQ
jgi:exosortase K